MPLEVEMEQRGKALEVTALAVVVKPPITCMHPYHGGSEMSVTLLIELFVFSHTYLTTVYKIGSSSFAKIEKKDQKFSPTHPLTFKL